MYVIKRDGRKEAVFFDKITSRIKKLCYGLSPLVEAEKVTQKVAPCLPLVLFCMMLTRISIVLCVGPQVCMGVYKGVTTSELDELAGTALLLFLLVVLVNPLSLPHAHSPHLVLNFLLISHCMFALHSRDQRSANLSPP